MQKKPSLRKQHRLIALILALICLFGSIAAASAEFISPTTGLTIPGEPTSPMMVVISYTEGTTTVDGWEIRAPGVGKRQTWGGLQADIVFEMQLAQNGATRLIFLYHDALVRGEQIYAGPVRSVRDVHVKLATAWNAGLVCRASHPYSAPALDGYRGQLFDMSRYDHQDYLIRVEGRKIPDNTSANVTAIHGLMQGALPAPSMWQFGDLSEPAATETPAVNMQDMADETTDAQETDDPWSMWEWPVPTETEAPPEDPLDLRQGILVWWEKEDGTRRMTHFLYSPFTEKYFWYVHNAPMKSWTDHTFTQEETMTFDNLIILRAKYSYPDTPALALVAMEENDMGEAGIWTKGEYQQGFWKIKDGRLLLVNEADEPMVLSPGKSYVAILPQE